jgi:hypothetical protein
MGNQGEQGTALRQGKSANALANCLHNDELTPHHFF